MSQYREIVTFLKIGRKNANIHALNENELQVKYIHFMQLMLGHTYVMYVSVRKKYIILCINQLVA